ncbi:hypothetical protein L1987_15495 [Smallanthus sonchifolius]|uniref:Uncharacterized protein n=1 Tax=Smallanthus sonchifolius TaxID=185202 RepID=A0ACB9J5S1_9ASTR|nr:hypothetical protein L1987_15495 [Smallanthus sonchifolius]
MFEKELQSDADKQQDTPTHVSDSKSSLEGENEVPKEKEHVLPSLTTHREHSLEDVQGHEKSRKGYELSIFGDDRVNQDSFPLTRKEHPGMHRMRTEVHTSGKLAGKETFFFVSEALPTDYITKHEFSDFVNVVKDSLNTIQDTVAENHKLRQTNQ